MESSSVRPLLEAATTGTKAALDELFPLVYEELRTVAHRRLRAERAGHTLNTTALVHEAYVKLVGLERIEYRNRAHFFAIAARAMRQILVNYAIGRRTKKRGGGFTAVSLDDAVEIAHANSDDLLALEDTLKRLETLDHRQSQVVVCKFFGGLSNDETAAALGISPATVKREWATARAWLNREVGGE
jgi:RNA polymerase sigma factor (TIGR02999 family)